jgi:putative transcriptional regulator
MKPAIVVFHKPERIDELAIRLAEIERIPLVTTDLNLDVIMERLKTL